LAQAKAAISSPTKASNGAAAGPKLATQEARPGNPKPDTRTGKRARANTNGAGRGNNKRTAQLKKKQNWLERRRQKTAAARAGANRNGPSSTGQRDMANDGPRSKKARKGLGDDDVIDSTLVTHCARSDSGAWVGQCRELIGPLQKTTNSLLDVDSGAPFWLADTVLLLPWGQ
jgi:hypothetical protein